MLKNHPKELWILAATELCERFSFWGTGNLLVLFLIEYYQFPNDKATHIYGLFTGFAAFLPLLGGWIADRWNYQSPLFIGALINALGCFMIATGSIHLLYLALVIIACGYGIFTPSILTVLGFTYRNKPELRETGFSIYYASINIGVFLALASLGIIAKATNWQVAFIVSGSVQLIGLIPLIYYLVHHKETYKALKSFQKETLEKKQPLSKVDKSRLYVIGVFCLISILFWIAYNQAFSSMTIFAHDFMDKTIGNLSIPESLFQSSEPFFLILLAPALSLLYAKLQRIKKDPSPAIKTGLSLLFMALCFFVMMIASYAIPDGAKSADVSWKYLVGSYFFMAIGEMLLAPIGLSMVSRLSPPRYTALSIGIWYVCVGIAFYTGGLLAGFMEQMGSLFKFFSIFVVMTVLPAIIMFIFAKKLTNMSQIDSHTPDSFTDIDK